MKRKLVRQGSSTLMVSLPSKWIKSNSLDKGSEVEIEEKDNQIMISGKPKADTKKEITIHLTEDNRHDIKNILTHLYRRGFDRIMIKNIDDNQQSIIRSTTNSLLLGFEIVDMTKDFCIIENISEPSQEKYEVMIRRIFLIIKESHRILDEDLAAGKYDKWQEMEEQRKQQDKHIFFCRRIIGKENRPLDWELLTFLMHIEHRYYYAYRYAMENRLKIENIAPLLKILLDTFELFYESYFQKDIKKIHQINKSRDEIYFKRFFSSIEKSAGKRSVMIAQLAEIYRLIQIGTSPILGLSLDNVLHQ